MKRVLAGIAWITVAGAFVATAIRTERFFLKTRHVTSMVRSWDETSFDYPFAVLFFLVCGLAPGLGLIAWGRPRGGRTTAVGAVLVAVAALMVAFSYTVTEDVGNQPLSFFAVVVIFAGCAVTAVGRPKGTLRIAFGFAVIAVIVWAAADMFISRHSTIGEALGVLVVVGVIPGLLLIAWGYTRLITIRWKRDRVAGGDAERTSETRTVCEICGRREAAAALYRYYPPVQITPRDDIPGSQVTHFRYSSDTHVDVLICDRCVDDKRRQALIGHGIGFLVSIPLTAFLVGVGGLLWFGSGLLKLRTREETGDILAINWRSAKAYRFAWSDLEPLLTRREFAKLAKETERTRQALARIGYHEP
jgi:hypothetical protein